MNIASSLFQTLGLTEQQGRVYLAALELGDATVLELARKSKVKRTSIYNFISELKEKQILTEIRKGKRNIYRAAHPEQLAESLKLKVLEFDHLLPKLLSAHERARNSPRVTFYEGVDGIKEVYADALREKKPIIAWTDWGPMIKTMGDYLKVYPVERAKRGITFRQIARESKAARNVTKRDKSELRSTKFINCPELSTEIMLYGDRVAIMSFASRPPLGIIIQDKDTAETLRVAWNALWERLP